MQIKSNDFINALITRPDFDLERTVGCLASFMDGMSCKNVNQAFTLTVSSPADNYSFVG